MYQHPLERAPLRREWPLDGHLAAPPQRPFSCVCRRRHLHRPPNGSDRANLQAQPQHPHLRAYLPLQEGYRHR